MNTVRNESFFFTYAVSAGLSAPTAWQCKRAKAPLRLKSHGRNALQKSGSVDFHNSVPELKIPARSTKPQMRGLLKFPQPSREELGEIDRVAALLQERQGPLRIFAPHAGMWIQLDSSADPKLCYQIACGEYEQDEIRMVKKYVKKGDRVLDIGGCIGVTSALSGSISGEEVVVVEPNPILHQVIKDQLNLSGSKAKIIGACVQAKSQKEAIFFVHPQPWRSALTAYPQGAPYKEIRIPSLSFCELLDVEKPDVVILDIEGQESELFKEPLRHTPKHIVIEIHDFYIGETEAVSVLQRIVDSGYKIIDRSGWNWVFEKNL